MPLFAGYTRVYVHLCADAFVWLRMCVSANFLIFIRWFVHWRNQTLCDSIEMSMNIFGRIFAHRHFASLSLFQRAIWSLMICTNTTELNAKIKPFELKQTGQGKKVLHKDTSVCQFRPNFIYLMAASRIFLSSSLFICLQTRSVCDRYMCVLRLCVVIFLVFHSRGNLFWLLFLPFDYLLLTSLQPHFPLRTHK